MLSSQDQHNTSGPVTDAGLLQDGIGRRCLSWLSRAIFPGSRSEQVPTRLRERLPGDRNTYRLLAVGSMPIGPTCPSQGPRPRIPRKPPLARRPRGKGKTTASARSLFSGVPALFISQPFDSPRGPPEPAPMALLVCKQIPSARFDLEFGWTAASRVHLRPSGLDDSGVSSPTSVFGPLPAPLLVPAVPCARLRRLSSNRASASSR